MKRPREEQERKKRNLMNNIPLKTSDFLWPFHEKADLTKAADGQVSDKSLSRSEKKQVDRLDSLASGCQGNDGWCGESGWLESTDRLRGAVVQRLILGVGFQHGEAMPSYGGGEFGGGGMLPPGNFKYIH